MKSILCHEKVSEDTSELAPSVSCAARYQSFTKTTAACIQVAAIRAAIPRKGFIGSRENPEAD